MALRSTFQEFGSGDTEGLWLPSASAAAGSLFLEENPHSQPPFLHLASLAQLDTDAGRSSPDSEWISARVFPEVHTKSARRDFSRRWWQGHSPSWPRWSRGHSPASLAPQALHASPPLLHRGLSWLLPRLSLCTCHGHEGGCFLPSSLSLSPHDPKAATTACYFSAT